MSSRNPGEVWNQLGEWTDLCIQQNTELTGGMGIGSLGPAAFLQFQLGRSSPERVEAAATACHQCLQQSLPKSLSQSCSIWSHPHVAALAILAVLQGNTTDNPQLQALLEFLAQQNLTLPLTDCETRNGRAGALQTIFWLRRELHDETIGQPVALSLAQSILWQGQQCAQQQQAESSIPPLLWQWKGTIFLGAAHGMVGILYTLLGLSAQEWDLLQAWHETTPNAERHSSLVLMLQETIQALEQHCHESGNLRVKFQLSSSQGVVLKDHQVDWAHGAPGYIWLLLQAHQRLGHLLPQTDYYQQRALQIAETVVWERRDHYQTIGLSVGLSGVSYLFSHIYQATKFKVWKDRARLFADRAYDQWEELLPNSQRPYAVLEGLGGVVTLWADSIRKEAMQFPFFLAEPQTPLYPPAQPTKAQPAAVPQTTSKPEPAKPATTVTAPEPLKPAKAPTEEDLDEETHHETSPASTPDDSDADSDEFGGADEEDAPDTLYLKQSQEAILDEEDASISPEAPPTEASERAQDLDSSDHQDLGDLMGSAQDDDEGSLADELGEFDRPDMQDQPMNQLLKKWQDSIDDKDSLFHDSSLALANSTHGQAALMAGPPPGSVPVNASRNDIDGGEHEDLGELMGSSYHDEEGSMEDDDEFGGPSEEEKPVNSVLQQWQDSIDNIDTILLDSTHANDDPASANLIGQSSPNRDIDSNDHEDLGELMGSRADDDESLGDDLEEFGRPSLQDEPENGVLKKWQDSIDDMDCFLSNTDSQPSKTNDQPPSNESEGDIDSNEHQDLGDLVLSTSTSDDGLNNDDKAEFERASLQDKAVPQMLAKWQNSIDDMDAVLESENVPDSPHGPADDTLDTGKHEDLGDLVDSRHVDDEEDDDEFGKASDRDRPDTTFLRDDSSLHENGATPQTDQRPTSRTLDAEKHEDLADLAGESASDDEAEEFGRPDARDKPVAKYLQAQRSIHSDHKTRAQADAAMMQNLDDEQHEDLGVIRTVSLHDDAEEFGKASEFDKPVERFLRAQDSDHGNPVRHDPERNLDDEKHTVLGDFLVVTASDIAAESDEFGGASLHDKPVLQYLQDAASVEDTELITKDDLVDFDLDTGLHADPGETRSETRADMEEVRVEASEEEKGMQDSRAELSYQRPILDEEGHNSVTNFHILIDEEVPEFQIADEKDQPVDSYLQSQESLDDLELTTDSPPDEQLENDPTQHGKVRIDSGADWNTDLAKRSEVSFTGLPPETPERIHASPSKWGARASPSTASSASIAYEVVERFCDLVLRKCLERSEGRGPLSEGGLGVSAYLRIKRSETELGKKRTKSLQTALKNAEAAMQSARRDGNVTLLGGEYTGSKCMAASILYRLDRRDEAATHVAEVLEYLQGTLAILPEDACGVMQGRAGVLQAIWYLRHELKDDSIGRNLAVETSTHILMEGLRCGRINGGTSLLQWKSEGKLFLGAANGIVGVLHSLLGHTPKEWEILGSHLPRVKEVVQQSIDSLHWQTRVGGCLRTFLDGDDEDYTMDWQNGSPGYCLLLIKASGVFQDRKYLNMAKWVALQALWPHRMTSTGVGLSRGLAGVAYVFLVLARADERNQAAWISRATHIVKSSIVDLHHLLTPSDHPTSLYQGLGGFVSLLMDLQRPETALFPFYDTDVKFSDALKQQPRLPPSSNPADGPAKRRLWDDDAAEKPTGPSKQQPFDGQKDVLELTENEKTSEAVTRDSKVVAGQEKEEAAKALSTIGETLAPAGSQTLERPPHIKRTTQDEFGGLGVDADRVSSDNATNSPTSPRGKSVQEILDSDVLVMLGRHLPKLRDGMGNLYAFVQRLEEVVETKSQVSHSEPAGTTPKRNAVDSVVGNTDKETPLSPLTDPNVTPGRPSPDKADKTPVIASTPSPARLGSQPSEQHPLRTPSGMVTPKQRKLHIFTTPDTVSVADKTTASWRAKLRKTPQSGVQPGDVDPSTTTPKREEELAQVSRRLDTSTNEPDSKS